MYLVEDSPSGESVDEWASVVGPGVNGGWSKSRGIGNWSAVGHWTSEKSTVGNGKEGEESESNEELHIDYDWLGCAGHKRIFLGEKNF